MCIRDSHSVTVILTLVCAAALGWVLMRSSTTPLRSTMSTWLFIAIVQGVFGYAQYFTGVPEVLVGFHIAGATILWVATVRLGLAAVDVVTDRGAPTSDDHDETQRLFGSTVTNV